MEKLKGIPSDDIQKFQSLQNEMRSKFKPKQNTNNNMSAYSPSSSFCAHPMSPSFTAHSPSSTLPTPSMKRNMNTNKNMYPHHYSPGSSQMIQNNHHKLSLPLMMNNNSTPRSMNNVNGGYSNTPNNRAMSLSPMFRQNSTSFIPSPQSHQSNRSISPNTSNTTMISPMYNTNQFHIN